MRKKTTLSLSDIENTLITDIIANATEIQKSLHKLMHAGNGSLYAKDYPTINPLVFLMSEFVKRPTIKEEATVQLDNNNSESLQ